MPDQTEFRRALAAHLDYYRELGVPGINRDATWSTRARPMIYANAANSPDPASAEADIVTSSSPASDTTASSSDVWISGDQGGIETAEPDAPTRPSSELLQELRADIGDCTRCKLAGLGRRQIVFGVGHPNADLMFVGEAPGRDEDEQGEPFVGRAGQLLTKIIEAIGLRREDVYIANVIKCRPPENRNPEPDEVATCEPFLFRQVDAIKPKVIVALGTFAAHALLKTADPISRLRGRVFSYRGSQLVPTFHPAFLLRSPERKRDTWEDMKKVRALLQGDVS